MKITDYLPQGVKDALFEEEPAPIKTPQALHIPPQKPPVNVPCVDTATEQFMVIGAAVHPPSVASAATAAILADLRSKTNFDTTPVGSQLKEATDALADTGLSDEQKSKTAMKLSHQSPAQVVSVLQGLREKLVAEKQKFEATMQTAVSAEVESRQAKSAQLQSSIDDAESRLNAMRQEKKDIDTELQEKQAKIASARTNYAAASEARNTELAEMISHYQSIPEVK